MAAEKRPSYSWWFDSHNRREQSPWLLSTLSELEEKTKGILKLIEEDADSFAKRAEMYYKKRPELVNMIEDLYRSHRSLAEQYDLLKFEVGPRRSTSGSWSFDPSFSNESWSQKLTLYRSSGPSSGSSLFEESEVDDTEPDEDIPVDGKVTEEQEKISGGSVIKVAKFSSEASLFEESEVDDPEPDEDIPVDSKVTEEEDKRSGGDVIKVTKFSSNSCDSVDSEVDDPQQLEEVEVESKVRENLYENENDVKNVLSKDAERLIEENKRLKVELAVKDDQKREVIRQLSFCVDILKAENDGLKKCIKSSKSGFFDFKKLMKGVLARKFFVG